MAYGVDAAQSFLQDSFAGGCFDGRLGFAGPAAVSAKLFSDTSAFVST
jgi:hypothetical protein